ncbi:response regulator [Streptomyces albipurpureus]|uniref:Response regulator n=1 Tax=Streptomyces albipurpureus TaxID=2897419 RepID=A0ABT0UMH0_9ACTN|nr:response regulator [Streptomyces sp. CWNU-1]MCM2389803.1 response regulator [Streptomyces sp. CWNU-1]
MNEVQQHHQRVDRRRILVVEPSAEDAKTIEQALSRTHPHLRLEFASREDGIAERLLAAPTLPGLVLLNVHLPEHQGHAVLRAIRSHPHLSEVTVVVFTPSTSPTEVDSCYQAGADSYVYKPVNFALFRTALKGAIDYWQDSASRIRGSLDGSCPTPR